MTKISFVVGAVLLAAACGVSETDVEPTLDASDVLEDGAELSTSSRTYVALRRDVRRCVSPMCGGWFVHDLNRVALTETYVNSLDFTPATSLSEREQEQVKGAADGEVVLRGKLGPKESRFNTRSFIVSEAWRGLPGAQVAAGESVFKVAGANVQCFRAPCPSFEAVRANYTAKALFHQIDFASVTEGRVDAAWLQDSVLEDGALAAGALVPQGKPGALDITTSLVLSQVFFKLPEDIGPCPQVKMAPCANGQTRTYKRDSDRCIVPSSCVSPGACALFVPACKTGYSLTSWVGGNFACTQYACDPAWVVEE